MGDHVIESTTQIMQQTNDRNDLDKQSNSSQGSHHSGEADNEDKAEKSDNSSDYQVGAQQEVIYNEVIDMQQPTNT